MERAGYGSVPLAADAAGSFLGVTIVPLGLIAAKRQRREEAAGRVDLDPWFLGTRQRLLASAMHRRDCGEDPHPDDAEALVEVEEMPWFYGLDEAPPGGMTGQELVGLIKGQGGLGSRVTLGGIRVAEK